MTVAQVELGVRSGYATASTCKIVAASLAAGNITISVTGIGDFVITPSAIGAVGYTGDTTITGLSSFTRYDYTATQGAKTAAGSFMTAPAATDDFSLFFAGCDCNTTYSDEVTGFWQHVKSYAQTGALPTVGVLFVDDHGYVDYNQMDDTAGTGLTMAGSYPAFSGTVADYAKAYLCNLGMLGDTANAYVAWGRDDSRVWCNQNLNYLPQWGDHEFINDFGFDYNKLTATALSGVGSATGVTIWANAKTAWDAFLQPLAPAVLNAANSNGWAMTLGCVNLVAPDGITNANGAWDGTAAGIGVNDPTTLFGTVQIDDMLNYVNDNPQPFNLFGMSHSIRYLQAFVDGPTAVFNQGAQHPLYDHVLSEYQRLFTASGNTPKSLMENNATNGVAGVTVLLHGDYHHSCVLKHEKPAYAGNLAENFYSVHHGTTNGSSNFAMPLAAGASYGGTTLEYESGWLTAEHNYSGLRVDVYGSRTVKEMHIVLMDSTGAEVWHGRFVQRSSNSTVPVTWEKTALVGTSTTATAL